MTSTVPNSATETLRPAWYLRMPIWAWLALFFSSVYVLTAGGHLGSDAQSRLEVGVAIANWRNVGLNNALQTYYATLQSLVFVPFYLIGRQIAPLVGWQDRWVIEFVSSFVSIPFGVLNSILLYFLCRQLGYTPRVGIALTLLYGLGTMAWEYSRLPYDHAQEASCLLAMVLFLLKGEQGERWRWMAFSGICFGLGILTRNNVAIVAPVVLTYFLARAASYEPASRGLVFRQALVFALGVAPFVAGLAWFNTVRFGLPWDNGHRLGLPPGETNPLAIFSVPIWNGLSGLVASPGRSLFLYQPVLLLAPLALIRLGRRTAPATMLLAGIPLMYVLFFATYAWWAVPAWGPRFLSGTVPFLVIPLGELFRTVRVPRLSTMQLAVIVLGIIGLLLQLGALTVPISRYYFAAEAWRASTAEQVDVAGDWRFAPALRLWGDVPVVVQNTLRKDLRDQLTFHNSPNWSWQTTLERAMEPNLVPQWWAWVWAAGLPARLVATIMIVVATPGILSGCVLARFLWMGRHESGGEPLRVANSADEAAL